MGKELQVHVGDDYAALSKRVVDAWHRAERGALSEANAERHVGFDSFDSFARIMTPRRLELLRHVHRYPPRSIRALAFALARDYRRVHEDVEALVNAGLIDKDETGLHADYDTVRMDTRIAM
ncbi:MAG TPA: hypothetical protein VND19_07910 [Acetobacteraceae bacterium]|nr:hypothetical protein [Acetobacteraceae bacterium]